MPLCTLSLPALARLARACACTCMLVGCPLLSAGWTPLPSSSGDLQKTVAEHSTHTGGGGFGLGHPPRIRALCFGLGGRGRRGGGREAGVCACGCVLCGLAFAWPSPANCLALRGGGGVAWPVVEGPAAEAALFWRGAEDARRPRQGQGLAVSWARGGQGLGPAPARDAGDD